MKKIVIPILIFLLALNSCKKDELEEITVPVFAGIYNDSIFYHEFNPPWEIPFHTDTTKNIKYGIDSIDIELDGNFDIVISQRIFLDWSDDFNTHYLEDDNFPFIGMRLKNGLEVAAKILSFPIGQGAYSYALMVDTILYQAELNKIDGWHNSNMRSFSYGGYYNNSIWLWGAPPASYWLLGDYGTWYRLNDKEMFIGIRKKYDTGYKLGWIKVKVYNHDKLEIQSYAIEK